MSTIIAGFFIAVLIIGIAMKFYLHKRQEKLVPQLDSRTPFKIIDRNEKSVALSTTIEFRNIGTQSVMIVDAICHPLLPFEQYDGIEVRGKVERDEIPREDDYFEALVIEHQESTFLVAKIKLTARKNLSLEEAIQHMVDFPIELLYREVGRNPMRWSIARIILPAEELARLVGVKLLNE